MDVFSMELGIRLSFVKILEFCFLGEGVFEPPLGTLLKEPKYFLKGLELLVHRCEKCVEIKGDCIEKQQSCFIYVTLRSWSCWKLFDPTANVHNIEIKLKCP
jgi:hypothetical protein